MQARILAIDDEPQFETLLRQRFRKQIREGRFEFVFADNGLSALKVLEEDEDIDMVLTDINMPRMDGLTLLGELKNIRPLLKTVIVSAYGDMSNIRKAMNLGAFDFVTKPIEFIDLEKTIEKTLREAELLKKIELAKDLAEKNERLSELDKLRSEFFTNISHEFRTPLTVISGMTEQIEQKPEKWLAKGVEMIRRNTDNLLDLVNQILDLRRLEAGKLSVKAVHGDVLPFIHYLFESFHSVAETRDIDFQMTAEAAKLIMDYDPEKLQRILSNLLGNALKFTPAGGTVRLRVKQEGEKLHLAVEDTGIGMTEEDVTKVFDRYFTMDKREDQKDLGTGIGLSLVNELVRLMDGNIRVESQEGRGTTFFVHLPLTLEGAKEMVAEGNGLMPSNEPVIIRSGMETPGVELSNYLLDNSHSDQPQLLIVEDNPDVAQYLVSCLEEMYQLRLASNGQEGIDLALELVPDIIISDVMMPIKDGFELCDTLKQDERTSHIPIVLLTAKADDESRLSGLQKGADAYLAKPFNKEELFVRLNKLLELRLHLQKKYGSLEEPLLNKTLEDDFITRIREEIEKNIDDEFFGITELCQSIGMSRAQLHRKLKALTGKSTSHYVRSIRLHHAKAILLKTDLNIAQVAFEVGFSDPKYFSRVFNEEFGQTPKAFREQ